MSLILIDPAEVLRVMGLDQTTDNRLAAEQLLRWLSVRPQRTRLDATRDLLRGAISTALCGTCSPLISAGVHPPDCSHVCHSPEKPTPITVPFPLDTCTTRCSLLIQHCEECRKKREEQGR